MTCIWPLTDDLLCGSPPRREAYCAFHSGVAAIQRRGLKADALAIEHQAACRLADEYDAAQERGEVAANGQRSPAILTENSSPRATAKEIGVTRKAIFEARQIRDGEKAEPGATFECVAVCVAVSLADLSDGMCRWIIDDDNNNYCGLPAAKSWCARHAAIVFETRRAA